MDKKFLCKIRRGMICVVDIVWYKWGFNSFIGIWIFLNVYCLYRKWFLLMFVFIVRVWRNIRLLYKNWWFSFYSNKMILKFIKNIYFFVIVYIFFMSKLIYVKKVLKIVVGYRICGICYWWRWNCFGILVRKYWCV